MTYANMPADNPQFLWKLQVELLEQAQGLLGPRDKTKAISKPSFHDGQPYTQLTIVPDGAFVVLSRGAERYLPTTIYEMAHETIHLLNPVPRGESNYLEEGIAVEFSIIAQEHFHVPIQTPESGPYNDALHLVRFLPPSPIEAAKTIREKIGPLSQATVPDLAAIFDRASLELLEGLFKKFSAG